jgi:hypothetical protein
LIDNFLTSGLQDAQSDGPDTAGDDADWAPLFTSHYVLITPAG